MILDLIVVTLLAVSLLNLIKYLPRLRAWFGCVRKQKRVYSNKHNKIAVVIPARNESAIIEGIFDSLQKQTYSKQFYDVHIIVDNEKDKTIEIAKKHNAISHVVKNQKCKGDALDGCLKNILMSQNDYDAIFIIDADCLLKENCLEELNNALSSGKQVIQAKRVVKNYLNKKNISLAACCNGLIWNIIDDLGNRYKTDHNITNMTIGTGLMIKMDLIRELNGWPYKETLTEDIEFMNDCAIKGYTTFYYSYAVIYVEEALSLHVTNKRRKRWLVGVVDSKRLYNSRLKELTSKEDKRNRYYVTALSPVFYYIGSLSIISFVSLACIPLSMLFFDHLVLLKSITYLIFSLSLIYISFFILTLFCLLVDRKNIRLPFYKKIALLLIHPIFYMGYIPIITKALVSKKNDGWEVIERIALETKN